MNTLNWLFFNVLASYTVQAFNFGPFKFGMEPTGNVMKRKEISEALLLQCRDNVKDRQTIESFIEELAPLNPTPASASSSLLQKEWLL